MSDGDITTKGEAQSLAEISSDRDPNQIAASELITQISELAKLQEVRLAGLDMVPMSEPQQLSASHWGRQSVINDEQCLEIFNAMLDAVRTIIERQNHDRP